MPKAKEPAKADDELHGLIRESMALRVMYRVLAAGGKIKHVLPLLLLCVNPQNRAGVYPQPDRVQNLGISIHEDGEDDSEANHNGVCVEEVPADKREKKHVTMLEHNVKKVAGTCLQVCFEQSRAIYGTLSHSHLLLILLSWLNGAEWPNVPLEAHSSKRVDWRTRTDRAGKLTLQNIDKDTALAKLGKNGLEMEILSWKMEKERPGSSSKISQALNKAQSHALKTTELSALAVLTGAITTRLETAVADEVTFQSVKDIVRHELDF